MSPAAAAVARWQALYESASPGKQLVLLIDLGGFGMRNFDKFFIEHAFRHLLSNHPQACRIPHAALHACPLCMMHACLLSHHPQAS